jgi:uncharacterized lipoprotein YehR (DUF1307 family)
MKRLVVMVFILLLVLSSLVLQGCGESEQSKLERERTQLEIEKLKREAEEQISRKKAEEEFSKVDKLKNFKPAKDPF